MTEGFAKEFLKPYYPVLQASIQHGWSQYHQVYTHPDHEARTRANLIHDHAVGYAKQNLAPMAGIRYLRVQERNLFQIRDTVILSFKKLDQQLLGSNYPTSFALEFAKQEHLPGIPDSLPRLNVGYVPDVTFTQLYGIFVTYPKSTGELNWSFQITDSEAIEAAQFTFEEQLTSAKKRVKVRRYGT